MTVAGGRPGAVDKRVVAGIIRRMTARVPRIGRLGLFLLAAVGAGCADDYNRQPFGGEADALTDVTQLTHAGGPDGFDRAGQARLSPDLRWVVFRGVAHDAGRGSAGYGLFVARARWAVDRGRDTAAGGDRHLVGLDRPVRITRVGVRCGGACFSPDGFSLAFTAADATGGGMRLYRADNWEQAVAMTDVARGVDLAEHPLTVADLSVDDCDWCPGGKSIVATASPPGGPVGLYALRPDGTRVIRLGPADARSPAFSPDGHRLAYRGGVVPHVFVADVVLDVVGDVVGLRDERELTHAAEVAATGPCWTPDGHRLVYATTRHGDRNAELYLMRAADGTGKTRLTMSAGPDVLPTVAADGRHLIWTAARPAGTAPQLFAADLAYPPGS